MYKIITVLMLCLFPFDAFAQKQDEAEEMGHLAGIMYACKAYKTLDRYEQIMGRYFKNTTNSPDAEKAKLQTYVQAKLYSYSIYRKRRNFNCAEMINDFSGMPLFKAIPYSDGSLQMPDGKFFYPRGQKKLAPDAKKL